MTQNPLFKIRKLKDIFSYSGCSKPDGNNEGDDPDVGVMVAVEFLNGLERDGRRPGKPGVWILLEDLKHVLLF